MAVVVWTNSVIPPKQGYQGYYKLSNCKADTTDQCCNLNQLIATGVLVSVFGYYASLCKWGIYYSRGCRRACCRINLSV